MAGPTISIINLNELQHGGPGEGIRRGAAEIGGLFLPPDGVTEADHQSARDAAMEFFENGTPEDKQAVTTTVPTSRRGYSGLEAESTALVTNTGDYSDYSMSFSMGMVGNLFPSPNFERVWTQY